MKPKGGPWPEAPSREWLALKSAVKSAPPWFLAVILVLGAGAILARLAFFIPVVKPDRGLGVSLRAAIEQGGDARGAELDEGGKPEPEEDRSGPKDAPPALEPPLEPSKWLDNQGRPSPIGPVHGRVDTTENPSGAGRSGSGSPGRGSGEKGGGAGSGSPWGDRSGTGRSEGVRLHGGSGASEEAVEKGLDWLRRHQSENGAWRAESFCRHCSGGSCGGEAMKGVGYDAGSTSLALLAFLGGGYTHKEGRFRRTVQSALSFLKAVQVADGRFSSESLYTQSLAVIALSEALALTEDPSLKRPLEIGTAFLVRAQQPKGGFSYDPRPRRERNDTSITVFALMALKAASAAGIDVPDRAFQGVARHLSSSWVNLESGEVYYADAPPGQGRKGLGMVAAALFGNTLLGMPKDHPIAQKQIALLKSVSPVWGDSKSLDQSFMTWYYANLSFFALGGEEWARWNRGFRDFVLAHQRRSGCADGSFDPVDLWGVTGGRIYSTAIHVLDLEIYYKYSPSFLAPGGALGDPGAETGARDDPSDGGAREQDAPDPAESARERLRRLRDLIGGK